MNDMIKRVAEAVRKHCCLNEGDMFPVAAARVAIEAMMTPTEEMLTEGRVWGGDNTNNLWRGMIQVALGEKLSSVHQDDLSPCPFCGAKAKYEWHSGEPWVECTECGANAKAWNARQAMPVEESSPELSYPVEALEVAKVRNDGGPHTGWWRHTDSHFWIWLASERVHPETIAKLKADIKSLGEKTSG